ncbi:MAG: ABC transporter substrate-binding protein [Salinarimonas sp.]|nr:ABC transporter substrate-binding protein [Salinarimonas sp.]
MLSSALRRGAFSSPLAIAILIALAISIPALDHAGAQDKADDSIVWSHGIAMHGEPALPADFTHFPYVNPDAPKGGRFTRALQGTFDSLNTYIVRGVAPDAVPNFVLEPLMARSLDEPFALYPLLAEAVALPDDRSSITFRINPQARFSDGEPVTAHDVAFSFEILQEHGRPYFRANYGQVSEVEIIDDLTIRFDLSETDDRELPLLLGLMRVMPAHAMDEETFRSTFLEGPVGSGPYEISDVRPGERLTLTRREDYWGADLPSRRGKYNFDTIRYEFFRDGNTMFEGFKTGYYDLRIESDATRWATGYDFPALNDGRVVREEVPVESPRGMNGFVFNTRTELFSDVRVREALSGLFDFEWVNRNLSYGLMARTQSYFEGSDLSAIGQPASEAERELLAPFPDTVRPDIMDGSWRPPGPDGSGRDRAMARFAMNLLNEAGWELDGNTLRQNETGRIFAFEFLAVSRAQERLALNYAQNLRRLGIDMRVRIVDDAQYWRRLSSFDFDMIEWTWGVSASPGNEQRNRWSSVAAENDGSLNFAGAQEPAIDAMVDAMLLANDHEEFVAAVRALDRVLLSGFYAVPLMHQPALWLAHDAGLRRPDAVPMMGLPPELWWRESE